MTAPEMRKTLEELEEFESVIDDVQNFKKKIKWFKAIFIEGSWESKGEEKKAEIGTGEKEEINLLKPFINEYEKYLLGRYNSQIETLQKAGIEIESKYKKEKAIIDRTLLD